MSREQIDEMAKVIGKHDCWDCENCKSILRKCEGVDCIDYDLAEVLYTAGYRNRVEAEWIAYLDKHEICATEFVCSNCKESFCTNEMTDWQFIETMKFCPNCGAEMKGGK